MCSLSVSRFLSRNFAIDPTGTCLLAANQNSDNIVFFKINRETGKLNPTEDK